MRTYGLEQLALLALERGDLAAARRRGAFAVGRGARLIRLLLRLAGGEPIATWRVQLYWLLAPERVRTSRLLPGWPGSPTAPKRAVRSPFPRIVAQGASLEPERALGAPDYARDSPSRHTSSDARVAHVDLLARAAAGEPLAADEVVAVAQRLVSHLQPADQARFASRGRELGARDADAAWKGLSKRLLDDLDGLLAAASGPLPTTIDVLTTTLSSRLRERLLRRLETAARHLTDGEEIEDPWSEYERWLKYRDVVEDLSRRFGDDAVRLVWYSGLRDTVWNWPTRLFNARGAEAAWTCVVMFSWVVTLAEIVGDGEAAQVNRQNAAVARQYLRTT